MAYSLCLHYSTACYNSLLPDLALWGGQETPEGCCGPITGLRRGRQRDYGNRDERWQRRGPDLGEKSTKSGLNEIKRRAGKTEGWGSGERWHRAQVDEEHCCLWPGATIQKHSQWTFNLWAHNVSYGSLTCQVLQWHTVKQSENRFCMSLCLSAMHHLLTSQILIRLRGRLSVHYWLLQYFQQKQCILAQ